MHTTRFALLVLTLLMGFGRSANAQTPSDPPRHRIDDLAWLAGQWVGEMGDGRFEEYWSEPRAGMMIGMFRLVGPDGKTTILEFEQFIETADGLELRFRHFSSDLEPREEAKQPLTLRLHHLDDESVVFVDPHPDSAKEDHPHRIVITRQGKNRYFSEVFVLRAGVEQRVFGATAIRAENADRLAADTPGMKLLAGCGSCVFGMDGVKGCPLAVKIDGKPYLVTGVDMDALGDAHAADGLCLVARRATALGKIEGDVFVAERMKLLPQPPPAQPARTE